MLAVHSSHLVVIDWPERAGAVLMVSTVSVLSVCFAAGILHRRLANKQPACEKFPLLCMMSDPEGLAVGECGESE